MCKISIRQKHKHLNKLRYAKISKSETLRQKYKHTNFLEIIVEKVLWDIQMTGNHYTNIGDMQPCRPCYRTFANTSKIFRERGGGRCGCQICNRRKLATRMVSSVLY